jgi:hypothetical protein
MAYRRKRRVDTTKSYLTGIPTFSRIGSMVKKLIASSQYDFFEGEAFEVTEVILNEPGNRGSVRGTFINNPKQDILGGAVKSLTPNITAVPVIGEHVVVTEYNGQHFYTSIINRKGSINENSMPGASGNYVKNTKYGETFERKDVTPIFINEGDIVFEGRFGQSIKFGSSKQKPVIKIIAGHRGRRGLGTVEDFNNDDSSIYLHGGIDNNDYDSKKIQIKSNDIFITGKRNLFLVGDEVFINAKKQNTIKMGDPRAPMLPTVNGQKMLEFQNSILGILTGIQSILVSVGSGLLPKVATDSAKLLKNINTVADSILNLSFLNFQVMTADPNFKLPKLPELPEVPDLPKVDLPKVDVSKTLKTKPSLDKLKKS